MGRLIDVDNITDEQIVDYLGIRYASCACDVRNMLNEQPTAYDPDKVVEQLKAVSYERYGNDGMGGELVVNLDDVVEIMKGGGVDAKTDS